MWKMVTPKWTLESVFDVTASMLQRHHFKAILLDLDNTIVAWNQNEPTPAMIKWVSQMREANIEVFILSNNTPQRVSSVASPLQLHYCANSLKPFKHAFKKAMQQLLVEPNEVVVIGDQVITDIIGANRMGLASILVKPIAQHDNIYTWLNRAIERLLLKKIGIQRQKNWGNQLD